MLCQNTIHGVDVFLEFSIKLYKMARFEKRYLTIQRLFFNNRSHHGVLHSIYV